MGNQLIGLAAGGKAEKLPFGNRGQNQPVLNHQTGECYITSQNHGYVINCDTLEPGWKTLFTNANDGSNEGIAHDSRPYLRPSSFRKLGRPTRFMLTLLDTRPQTDPVSFPSEALPPD
jgi:hypothetical protein